MERQLGRYNRNDPATAMALCCVHLDQRSSTRTTHGLWEVPTAKQTGAERTAPAGDSVGIVAGVTDQTPARPLVELGLIGTFLLF